MKKRYHFYIAGGLLLIGLILGSIFDLALSEAIFDRFNGFGLAISAFGMIPGYGALAFLGGALFAISFKNKQFPLWLRIIFYVLTLGTYGVSTYFLGRDVFGVNGIENKNIYWLGFLIMGIVMVGATYLGYFFGKKNENPKMWIIILILLGAMFLALVPGTTLLKAIMHRPRYRIAVNDGSVLFHDWWRPCKDYEQIIAKSNGVLTKEEFKSFPSGHSTAVMCGTILMTTIPLLDNKLMKYQPLFFWCAFAWSLLMMFSRILVGAHYLTDTCVGALLTIIFFYIANEVIVRKLLPSEVVEEKKEEVQE